MEAHPAPSDWMLWVGLCGAVLSALLAITGFLIGLLLLIVGWIFNQNQMRVQRSQDSAWSEIRQMKERNAQFSHVTAANMAVKGDIESAMDRMTSELTRIESAFNSGFGRLAEDLSAALQSMLPRAEFELHQRLTEQRLASIASAANAQAITPAGAKG